MSQDYIPRTDGDFLTFETTFIAYADTNKAALGLVAADLTPVTTARDAWEPAYLDNDAKQAAARAARQLKDEKRAALEAAIRALVRRLQASPAVSDEERKALGITVRDTTPTMHTATVAAATRPVGVVSTAQRLRHEIRFFDEATPTRKAKPDGVMGCEIWVKVGTTPPADISECTFLALDTASPYVADYPGSDAGKTAFYMLRWVTTRGDKGPCSETVAATITG